VLLSPGTVNRVSAHVNRRKQRVGYAFTRNVPVHVFASVFALSLAQFLEERFSLDDLHSTAFDLLIPRFQGRNDGSAEGPLAEAAIQWLGVEAGDGPAKQAAEADHREIPRGLRVESGVPVAERQPRGNHQEAMGQIDLASTPPHIARLAGRIAVAVTLTASGTPDILELLTDSRSPYARLS